MGYTSAILTLVLLNCVVSGWAAKNIGKDAGGIVAAVGLTFFVPVFSLVYLFLWWDARKS